MKIWEASYEFNWGTRQPRHFISVYFKDKPTLERASLALSKKLHRIIKPEYFGYGPCELGSIETED